MKSRVPMWGIYKAGFKGKGMCSHCAYSSPKEGEPTVMMCKQYASECKLVSRNCPGIPVLKSESHED